MQPVCPHCKSPVGRNSAACPACGYSFAYSAPKTTSEMSWAAYALDGREHPSFRHSGVFLDSVRPEWFVLDVGFGYAGTLLDHIDRGGRGVGTEIDEMLLKDARSKGLDVAQAPAENLPFATGSVDTVIFSGVLPFTDEDQAFGEIARVLRPGGRVETNYLGWGFALRDIIVNRDIRKRYFGLRAFVNSVLMSAAGAKLPGKYGDTVYITPRRLANMYARHGFVLRKHTPSPTFLGLPVFIYHSLERR